VCEKRAQDAERREVHHTPTLRSSSLAIAWLHAEGVVMACCSKGLSQVHEQGEQARQADDNRYGMRRA
jgi:hypothetical protein